MVPFAVDDCRYFNGHRCIYVGGSTVTIDLECYIIQSANMTSFSNSLHMTINYRYVQQARQLDSQKVLINNVSFCTEHVVLYT